MTTGSVVAWRHLPASTRRTAAGLAALPAVLLLWSAQPTGPRWWQVAAVTQGLAWWAVAEAGQHARPGRRAGGWTPVLFLLAGACLLGASVLFAVDAARAAGALAWTGAAVALPLALTGYPHGAPRSRGERATAALVLVLGLAGLVPDLPDLLGVGTGELRAWLGFAQIVVLVPALWWRGEHADSDTRLSLLWAALGACGAGLVVGHVVFVGEAVALPDAPFIAVLLLVGLLVPASVAIGLAAPRLFDVRRLISGVAVSLVMIDLTVGVVAGSLAGIAWATGEPASKGATAVLATGCAAAFAPVLLRVRRTVEEVLFGGSPDPLDVMSRLGAELAAAGSPTAWAQALRTTLVVPCVELRADGACLGVSGTGHGPTETTALQAGGAHVGDLVVTLPAGLTALPPGTRAVLRLVAAPLARALQAVRLADQLHASRERVVQAREEERRRLRRDLHDGLGPVLTGVAYTADAALNQLHTDSDRAAQLLAQLRQDTGDSLDEVRRIVQGLRPPALDEVGLTAALRQHTTRYGEGRDIEVRSALGTRDAPGRLPAAVEVVAYRVAVEGVTNAVRHARRSGGAPALRVLVTLQLLADELVVTVRDDGADAAAWAQGAGLASMRSRCDEIGGSVVAGPVEGGGLVEARLPLGAAAPSLWRQAEGPDPLVQQGPSALAAATCGVHDGGRGRAPRAAGPGGTMTPKPHDVADLRLAPVALQLDARLEALGQLSAHELASRVVLENNHPLAARSDRERDLLFTVTRLIELGGWVPSWDERGLRLVHGKHALVLGLPATLSAFLSTGSDAVSAAV